MTGASGVVLAGPELAFSGGLDAVIRFLVDKPLAIAGILVREFLSGVFILVEDQFGVGGWVDVGEATGSVEAITLRATRIRSVDGTVWHVPNGQIRRAGNMSQHWSRALLDVQIALDSDIDRARAAMKRIADATWRENDAILEDPRSGACKASDPAGSRSGSSPRPSLEQWQISRLLRERIKAEFEPLVR